MRDNGQVCGPKGSTPFQICCQAPRIRVPARTTSGHFFPSMHYIDQFVKSRKKLPCALEDA
jgi:hypothetical protein